MATGGKEAASALGNYANDLMNTYPDKVDQISAIISNINWDQGGDKAMSDLRDGLEDVGI
jgi:hypothetical protein